jgi:hypothetical protein
MTGTVNRLAPQHSVQSSILETDGESGEKHGPNRHLINEGIEPLNE